MAAALLLAAAILSAFTASSSGGGGNWCVCKDGSDSVLQKTLDYACGAGADCNPIRQNGPCFQPNTVRAHCNYAVNSYFQRKGQTQEACQFAGTATVTASDPSSSGCSYPSSASNAGTSTTSPTTTTPSTNNPSTSTGTGTSSSSSSSSTATPYSSATTPGVLGGIGNSGIGPSGAGMNTDESHGGLRVVDTSFLSSSSSSFSMLLFSSGFIMLWWG